ncbi:5716_t:CDS:10, partial [Ambispora leptoticha]
MAEIDQQQLQSLVLSAELNSENENLEQLGPIIKSIYDNGRQEAFLEQLTVFVRKKEGEIERMCNSNYQEFVHSVDQLLKVRQGTVNLKNKIIDLNYDVQLSGKKLATKKKELIQTRKIQKNIDEAVETLQTCLYVLDLANRANSLIEEKKYYSALRTIEELQTVHLRKVSQYEFARHMQESIPVMQNNIKDAVTRELQEWLFKVREVSSKVGKLAIEQLTLRQERWKQKVAQNKDLASAPVNSPIELAMNEENEFNVVNNDQVQIDFKPLYQCLHIYEELGKRSEFKANYEEDRRAQANLVLSANFTLKDGDIRGFESFLDEIVGFFVIEYIIVHSTHNFRSQREVDILWDSVTTKVIKMVSNALRECHSPELFVKIKHYLTSYIQTFEEYSYNTHMYTDLHFNVYQRYSEMLKEKFAEDFHQTILDDDYMPMVVNAPEEYEAVVDACWFKDEQRANAIRFPRTLPFSQAYPSCCLDIKNFVDQFYDFAEDASRRHNYLDDILKEALDALLIEHVNGVLLGKLQSTNLTQIVQIIINLEYFENMCAELEKLLKDRRSMHRGGRIQLNASNEFHQTRKKAEKRIFELVNSKIDDFLELADYDWAPSVALSQPSPFLQDMVGFLTTVISSTLYNLPVSIKTFIYFDALAHLSTSLHDLILSPEVKKINVNGITNFDNDVRFLEQFAQGLDNPNIADAFMELRQIVNLLQCENMEEYLTSSTRNKKYSRIKPADVVNLIEKMLKDQSVISLSPSERSRKRGMETVLRSLKPEGVDSLPIKALTRIVAALGPILIRSFAEAYKQHIANQAAAQGRGRAASAATGAANSVSDALTQKTKISIEEACQILNVKKEDIEDIATVARRFEHLHKMNDPSKNGSFYIQRKVENARDRIQLELLEKAKQFFTVIMTEFKLSATLIGHEQDVRGIRAVSDSAVVSVSRDKTVRLWSRLATTNVFTEDKVFLGHTHFVTGVAVFPATQKHPKGLIASGSSDKTINIWDPEHPQDPIYSLIGHTDNICALDVSPSGYLVSGSWDKTVKLWVNWQVSYTLQGHTAAVWAVLAIEDDGKRTHIFKGHTDCVRGLCVLPDLGFVSCSNDSTVRIWTLTGDCIQELNGHISYVYSIFVLSTGEIVSSGEDRSVKVWKDGTCIQTILHPATSVWCVAGLPNGDIISGASDYQIRIFTRAEERTAELSVLKEFDDEVAKQAIPSNQIGDIKKDELPGPEALLKPGDREGQVLMVRSGDLVEAHMWNASSKTWAKMGEVVDAVGQGRKQLFNGREYDYVFDVDIGDGVPPLKLPYNVTDNPYQAAQDFIWANELPQSYLDQIANFIIQNAKGVTLGAGASQYQDPFTGGSRYTPGAGPSNNVPGSRPGNTITGIDPWTRPGPSTTTSSTAAPSSKPSSANVLPQKSYLSFKQANVQAIYKKIGQINNELQSDPLTSSLALTPTENSTLGNLIKFLENPSVGTDSSEARQNEFAVIHKICTSWPFEKRFPGLDLLRLVILYSPIAALYKHNKGSIINLIMDAGQLNAWSSESFVRTKEYETNLMLALRSIANLFEVKEGWHLLREASSTQDPKYEYADCSCDNLSQKSPDEDFLLQLIATIVEFLENETDSEVIYRAMVTMGTLIISNGAAKDAAKVLDVQNVVKKASEKAKEERIVQITEAVFILYTVWEWNEELPLELADSFSEIQEKYEVTINFLPENQAQGSTKNIEQSRNDQIFIYSKAKRLITIPQRQKQADTSKAIIQSLHPFNEEEYDKGRQLLKFGEETEGLERPFFFDYRVDIEVNGDVFIEEKQIMVNGAKTEDIEEAMRRLHTLQEIHLRPPYRTQRIPLVHHPNQNVAFKLLFYPLKQHAYFKDKFSAIKSKEPFILVAVQRNEAGEYNVLPNGIDIEVLPPSLLQNKAKKNAIPQSPIKKELSKSNDPNNNRSLKTEEEKQARKEAKKARIAKMKYEQAMRNNSNLVENPAGSSTRILVENEAEKKSNEETELKPKVKNIVMEKSPDTDGPFDRQQVTFGKRVRDYNFNLMKKAFSEAFEYARAHRGEIRFHGSIGKVSFSKVTARINSELWEFTDLKDILVGEMSVSPVFTDMATEHSRVIELVVQLLSETLPMEPSAKTAFFEINADARNNPNTGYVPVTMLVNCDYVALNKVALRWNHLVNFDWSILDRKVDFQLCLKTRTSIRNDVKPFSTFIKKASVHPANRTITYENIPDYLEVTSITYKVVNKFKLHYPFIMEVTRVEELPLKQQPNSKKFQGGTGRGKPYYTIEVINDVIREKFKDNQDLSPGKLGNWTVEDILGEEPESFNLINMTKTMLMLIERCNRALERRAAEEADKAK